LIPLTELISNMAEGGLATKKVWAIYNNLLKNFKSEYHILLNAKKEDLEKAANPQLADAIIKNRRGEIKVTAGYDGEYGFPVFTEKEKQSYKAFEDKQKKAQKTLANF